MTKHIDVVFDGPPNPDGPRFIEVETDAGISTSLGEWVKRPDGYWALRIEKSGLNKLFWGREP